MFNLFVEAVKLIKASCGLLESELGSQRTYSWVVTATVGNYDTRGITQSAFRKAEKFMFNLATLTASDV